MLASSDCERWERFRRFRGGARTGDRHGSDHSRTDFPHGCCSHDRVPESSNPGRGRRHRWWRTGDNTETNTHRGEECSAMKNAVVVVAGAGGPAGRAVVPLLAAAGARVVAVGRRPLSWDDVGDAADRITSVSVDLLDAEATRDFAADVEHAHGRVDGLVHLVGGWRGGESFADTDL